MADVSKSVLSEKFYENVTFRLKEKTREDICLHHVSNTENFIQINLWVKLYNALVLRCSGLYQPRLHLHMLSESDELSLLQQIYDN